MTDTIWIYSHVQQQKEQLKTAFAKLAWRLCRDGSVSESFDMLEGDLCCVDVVRDVSAIDNQKSITFNNIYLLILNDEINFIYFKLLQQ